MQQITLSPDKNHPNLESKLAYQLKDGIIPNSTTLNYNPWQSGKNPRVLLIVPPYTRIKRPLEVIANNLKRTEKNLNYLQEDKEILSKLKENEITHFEEMKRAGIPMGLLRIGTAAKKKGYDIKILDAPFEGWNNEKEYFTSSEGSQILLYGLSKKEIAKRIKSFKPDIVGISIDYTHQWGNAREISDLVKKINEEVIVVMGGAHAHALPQDVLLDSPTDYVVLGQGDVTFPELLDSLTKNKGRNLNEIKGIAYRKNGEIKTNQKRDFLSCIDSIAIPDLSLVNLDLYSGKFHSAGERKLDFGKLIYGFTSIGCDTHCTFCTIPKVQGPWRAMSEKKLDEYLKYIKQQGVSEFIVEDDHLLHNPRRAMNVFENIKQYNFPWVEEGGVSLFNLIALLPEVKEDFIKKSKRDTNIFKNTLEAKASGLTAEKLIKSMGESGCYNIYLAAESTNDKALSTANKPTLNTQEYYASKVVGLFKKYNIKTTVGLMLGFMNPGKSVYVESRENIKQTIAYGKSLKKAGANYINPFIFTPLPGAPHFNQLKNYVINNTDEGFSHEFGTLDAPDKTWTRDSLNLLRTHSIIETNGIKGYSQILKTGTWPV